VGKETAMPMRSPAVADVFFSSGVAADSPGTETICSLGLFLYFGRCEHQSMTEAEAH
jgi:hypothetical protein